MVPALKQDQLKDSLWKIEDSKLGTAAYLFHFDKEKATLRFAYGTKLAKDDIKTRAAEVKYEIKDGKVTVEVLKLKDAKIEMKDDTLTITATPNIVLKKVKDADVLKLEFNKNKDEKDVEKAFNETILKLPFMHPSEKAFKIEKLNDKIPGKKKDGDDKNRKVYHVAFTKNTGKIILAVELKDKNYKTAEKAYTTSTTHEGLGKVKMQITMAELSLNSAVFTFDGNIITIDKTVLTAEKYPELTKYDNESGANEVTVALASFDQDET